MLNNLKIYLETHKNSILIGFIVFGGFLLRVISINWGLPLKKGHIDESVVILTMRFLTGDLNPGVFFDYPTLFLYILSGLFYSAFIAGKVFGIFKSLDQFVGIYLNQDASFIYMIARSVSVLLGTASIYLVYKIAKDNSFRFAVAGALLLAILPIHVLHSHYATVDVACTFFVLFAFLFLGRYLRGARAHSLSDLYKGCFILGLAAATKYYPIVFFVPLVFIITIKENFKKVKAVGVSFALILAGFVAGCPFSVLDHAAFFTRFIDRFSLIVWAAPADAEIHRGFQVFSAFGQAFTTPVLLFLLSGIILSLVFSDNARRKNLLFWLSFPSFLLAFMATWKVLTPHYLMPLIPFLCIIGVNGYGAAAKTKFKYPAFLMFLIICVMPLSRSVNIDRVLSLEDTRLTSYKWIKKNLPAGSRLLRFANTPEFSGTDPFRVQVDWENKLYGMPVETLSGRFDYIITSHFDNNEPDPASADRQAGKWEKGLLKDYKLVEEWQNIPLAQFHHPRIVIYGKKT